MAQIYEDFDNYILKSEKMIQATKDIIPLIIDELWKEINSSIQAKTIIECIEKEHNFYLNETKSNPKWLYYLLKLYIRFIVSESWINSCLKFSIIIVDNAIPLQKKVPFI